MFSLLLKDLISDFYFITGFHTYFDKNWALIYTESCIIFKRQEFDCAMPREKVMNLRAVCACVYTWNL